MYKNLLTAKADNEIFNRQAVKLNQTILGELATGKYRSFDQVLRHRALVEVGSGIKNLLLSTNDKVVGISDFSGNKLPDKEFFATKQIRVGYDWSTAAGQEALLAYDQEFTPTWKSAELKISQAGKEVLRFPISDLISKGPHSNPDDRYITLELPFILVGLKVTEIQVEFPEGSVKKQVGTVDQKEYVEIVQKGTIYIENV